LLKIFFENKKKRKRKVMQKIGTTITRESVDKTKKMIAKLEK